jgi:tripartite-type tricarboxylate transporter receptor subunit TctC
MKLAKLAAGLAAGLALVLTAGTALAQAYPGKPIRIIVPFAAGGTSDILARQLGAKLTESWGQPVVVENKTGANGNVGADFVAKSAPDGYTLLLMDIGAIAINPSVYPNMPFDPVKDFSAIGFVGYSPHILAVHPSVPVNSVAELVSYAKANPGKLNFATSGLGGAPHLAGVDLGLRTGANWTFIHYKGGSQAVADVAAGQANMIMNGMIATYPQVKAGKMRILAVSGAKRVAQIPDVPTIGESLPGFETGSWQGILAAAGTPRDIVAKLNGEINRILNTPEMKERLLGQGAEVRTDTPEAMASWISSEKSKWAKVIKDSGVKLE